jgi:hypothetical protein
VMTDCAGGIIGKASARLLRQNDGHAGSVGTFFQES